ncbi:PAS domain-containing protein [Gluconobacter kanchanaburiensis]|uniref:histidine kinase n=1 Tax=Gluconobacter kanchanaburiensis NBRC 103587 TaxID=1307948 RepID=A0A511B558_9PROT|nr:PAS domain-containing protein [Gluconobacter kanchanaburiensis]MBF0861890.1 PAS domain-containing protein [Gluconobacter kanchanaburiensis]GBR67860.1 signal transduction histidine kinase [Gluconobacter kanchanaburiensis NBRC 103587]GEK95585.1 hybrid sensor histidine kinase/response regulator [Gluconobacter kanchanaburiensis NBRC 103587]
MNNDEHRHGVALTTQGSPDQPSLQDREALNAREPRHWAQTRISDPTLENKSNVFFAAVEMTRMPMILADPRLPDCPIAFANNAFLDLTGYESGEVVGRNCRFLQGSGTDPNDVRQLREAIAECKPVALEILNYRRNGTPFWNAIFMGPVFDEDGELIYFFASQLDVSKRRESEMALRQGQKMEAIGQLTAGLAHDFNNLLQILNNSLERMKEKRLDHQAFERQHMIAQQAAERGARLTRQLLSFARRTRLDPVEINLSSLINSFRELIEMSVGNQIELYLNLRLRLPDVKLDTNYFEMALLNVIANARDASMPGNAITIKTELLHLNGNAEARRLKPGDYVVVTVSDEGQGMLPHIVMRATEPFFTTKPSGQGTGLGLAMVQGFVQQSGGRLEVESEYQRGTSIHMIFPVHAPRDPIETGTKNTGYKAHFVEEGEHSPHILVVEDNSDIAQYASDSLTEIGYQVTIAQNGTEALEVFERALAAKKPFRAVFSDVIMPGGLNGLVLADKISRLHPQTPVILTTGYNDEMSLNGPENNNFEVLGKPYQRSELIDRIQAALKNGSRSGDGRQTSDFGHVEE